MAIPQLKLGGVALKSSNSNNNYIEEQQASTDEAKL
jgi:hypothetical protein